MSLLSRCQPLPFQVSKAIKRKRVLRQYASENHAQLSPLAKKGKTSHTNLHEDVLALARPKVQSLTSQEQHDLYKRWEAAQLDPQPRSGSGRMLPRTASASSALAERYVGPPVSDTSRIPVAQVDPASPSVDQDPAPVAVVSAEPGGGLKQLRKARLAGCASLARLKPRTLRERKQFVRTAVGKSAPDLAAQMALLREALTPEQWLLLRHMGKVLQGIVNGNL